MTVHEKHAAALRAAAVCVEHGFMPDTGPLLEAARLLDRMPSVEQVEDVISKCRVTVDIEGRPHGKMSNASINAITDTVMALLEAA